MKNSDLKKQLNIELLSEAHFTTDGRYIVGSSINAKNLLDRKLEKIEKESEEKLVSDYVKKLRAYLKDL